MGKAKRWTLLILLLLASLTVSAVGAWMFYQGLVVDNRFQAKIGMVFLFGGMTVVPLALGILGNYFIKSERTPLVQSQRPFATLGEIQQKRILERKRKRRASLAQHREHPYRSLWYLAGAFLVGLALGGAGLFEEMQPVAERSSHDSPVEIMVLGGLLSVGAICVFTLCLRKIITKQWLPEFDAALAKLDEDIRQLEESATKPTN